MKFRAKHLFILLLLLSVVIQCAFGDFPFAFFAFPLDALLALFWIVGMAYAYKENRSSKFVQMWLAPQCTYWTLGWIIAGSLVIGLFPQLPTAEAAERSGLPARLGFYHFTTSWIFVAGLFALLTHLGMITLRRAFRPGRNRWRFVLNHAGLWLALFAGVVGSAEEQTLRIPVFRDRPNNEAVTEEGITVLLPKQLKLNDFTVEQYPNGTPRHFFAEISIDGKPARLEVNHPYAASWGEQYYLTSYDMQSGQPQYCVVQIVREPLKYLMLAGIIMLLCGACLLFLAGPNAQKNGPSETSRPRETYNKCVQV